MIAGTTVVYQEVASSMCNEKVNAQLQVTASKLTGPAAGIMTDEPTLHLLLFLLQGLMENHVRLNFLSSQYPQLLSQLAKLHTSEPQKLRMIRVEIAKVASKLAFSRRMDRAGLTDSNIRMLLVLLKRCPVRLPQEVDD